MNSNQENQGQENKKNKKGVEKRLEEMAREQLEDFNRQMDLPPGEFTEKDQMTSGILWVLMGLFLVNLEVKGVPWVAPLGWLITGTGLITMAVGWFLTSRKERKEKKK